MNFDSPLTLLYHTYNSLFLSLPFRDIESTGTRLALFAQSCEAGFKNGHSPEKTVHDFREEYFEEIEPKERLALLFSIIQYIDRQVVLFDAVEDSLFTKIHDMNGPGSLSHFMRLLDTELLRQKLVQNIK